jgi:hypothetical protein
MKIFALTTAILLTASAFGAKISYDYDKAGNRIKRWLVVEEITNTTEAEFRTSEKAEDAGAENEMRSDDVSVSVYPNPTIGVVTVDIPALDESGSNTLHLYDAKGETVLSRKRLMNSNTIDFMNTPSGVYILKLNLGGSEKSYKIIKKQ